jgi:hypothetical protein
MGFPKGEHVVRHWDEKRIPFIMKLAALGLSDISIAEGLEIDVETFRYWKKNHLGVREAVYEGRTNVALRIAEAAIKKSIGYEYEEEVATYDRSKHQWVKTTVKKYMPPDAWAAYRYLELHYPEQWSVTKRVQISQTNLNITVNTDLFVGASTEDLLVLEKYGLKMLNANTNETETSE